MATTPLGARKGEVSLLPNPKRLDADGGPGGKAANEKENRCFTSLWTALQWLTFAATLPGCRNALAPAQKWPAMTMPPRAGHGAGAWPGQGSGGAVCQPCPTGEQGGMGGQKATLFSAAEGMNGVLKTTTSESRLVFMPCH